MLALEGVDVHSDCGPDQCQFAQQGQAFEGETHLRVFSREIIFDGCPRRHLYGYEAERSVRRFNWKQWTEETHYAPTGKQSNDNSLSMWLSLYGWLDNWHTTPMQMGLPIEKLDPRFFEAMELIRDTQAEIAERKKK